MRLTLLLLILTILPALSEIMGWKVPLSSATQQTLPDYRAIELDDAPCSSAFFKKGDPLLEITDLIELTIFEIQEPPGDDPFAAPEPSRAVGTEKYSGDWVVWNKRSNMIIAKGTPGQLEWVNAALQTDELPHMIQTSLTIIDTDDLYHLVMITSRSGEKAEIKTDAVKLFVEAHLGSCLDVVDLQVTAGVELPTGEIDTISSALTMNSGKTYPLAAWTEPGANWTMTLKTQIIASNGVPVNQIRWVDRGGKLGLWNKGTTQSPRLRFGTLRLGELYARVYDVPPDLRRRLAGNLPQTWPAAIPPESLSDQIYGSFFDVRKELQMNGVEFKDSDSFAGFTRQTAQLVILGSESDLELVEQIVRGGFDRKPYQVKLVADWQTGFCQIMNRSGELVSISRTIMDKKTPLFRAASDIGANGDLADVTYKLTPTGGPFDLESAATLTNHQAIEIGSFTEGEEEYKVTLKASIGDHGH